MESAWCVAVKGTTVLTSTLVESWRQNIATLVWDSPPSPTLSTATEVEVVTTCLETSVPAASHGLLVNMSFAVVADFLDGVSEAELPAKDVKGVAITALRAVVVMMA
jgi:hypothetical protein